MSNATFFDFNDDDLDFNYRALLEVPDGAVKQEEVASTAAPPEESTGTGQELRGIEYSQKVVVENVLEKFESMKRAGLLKYPTGYKNDNMVNEGGEAKRSETEEEKVARLKAVALAHVKRYEEALVAFCNLPTIKGTDEEKLKQEYRYSQRFVFWFCAMVILDASFLAACVREEQATAGGARGSGSFGYKDPAAAAIASFWRGFAEAADKMMGKYMQDICEAEFCAVMSPKPFMSARQNGFRTIAALAYHLSGTELFNPGNEQIKDPLSSLAKPRVLSEGYPRARFSIVADMYMYKDNDFSAMMWDQKADEFWRLRNESAEKKDSGFLNTMLSVSLEFVEWLVVFIFKHPDRQRCGSYTVWKEKTRNVSGNVDSLEKTETLLKSDWDIFSNMFRRGRVSMDMRVTEPEQLTGFDRESIKTLLNQHYTEDKNRAADGGMRIEDTYDRDDPDLKLLEPRGLFRVGVLFELVRAGLRTLLVELDPYAVADKSTSASIDQVSYIHRVNEKLPEVSDIRANLSGSESPTSQPESK